MTMFAELSAPIATLVAAAVAAAVALFVSVLTRRREDADRRRETYSEAYRAGLEWCEAVYRVRRRAPDGSEDRALVERFHVLQERIAYFQGWISIESTSLGTSYQAFLDAVLAECRPLLQEAWTKPGRDPTTEKPENEKHPDLTEAKATFLRAVREHLTPWWKTV